jgi:MarR family transcriptional regulator, organic hydroperoxide resistance regulator
LSPDPAGLPLSDDQRFLRLLWRLDHAIEKRSKRMEATLGVTFQQRTILRTVGRFPSMTAGQLAEVMHVDRGTVSAALRRLEARGLIQRRRDSRDQRRVLLGLTGRGRAFDGPAEGTVEHAVQETLCRVGVERVRAAEEVIMQLVESLERTDTSVQPSQQNR